MLNQNQKRFLHKNKDKIGIGAAVAFLLIIILVAVLYFKSDKNPGSILDLPESEIKVADQAVCQTEKGLSLVSLENGSTLAELNGTYQLKTNHDGSEALVMQDNTIYGLKITSTDNTYKLETTPIYKSTIKVDDFLFNEKYIAVMTSKGTSNVKVEKEKKKESTLTAPKDYSDKSETLYDITIVDRVSGKTYHVNNVSLTHATLLGNAIVTANVKDEITTYDFIENTNSSIYTGNTISDLITQNDKVIAFSKFGNGMGNSVVLELNADLTVSKASKHDGTSILPIKHNIKDEKLLYLDTTNSLLLYELDFSGDRETKNKTNLNLASDSKSFAYENTCFENGYIYTTKDNTIEIIDVKSGILYKTVEIPTSQAYFVFKDKIPTYDYKDITNK